MTQFSPSRFEILPLVIKNLLIINVLFFLAQLTIEAQGIVNLEDWFSLHYVGSPLFKPWQFVTYMFVHATFMHLFGNMFALWMFGSILENLWGPKRFLTFYFICGIGAAFIYLIFLRVGYSSLLKDLQVLKINATPDGVVYFFEKYSKNYAIFKYANTAPVNIYLKNPDNPVYLQQALSYMSYLAQRVIDMPILGASGAVFGILVAFVYLFPNAYIYLYFLIPVKAKWLGLIYFGQEIFLAFQNSADDDTARWAHIGGGLVGFLLVLTWNKTNRKRFY